MSAIPWHHVLLDDLPHQARVLLQFSGADVSRFLQGLLSADVNAVAPGTARPATLLTVKGKIVSEVIVMRAADESVALAVPSDVADAVQTALDRHIIMDDVTLTRPGGPVGFAFAWGDDDGALAQTLASRGALATTHPAPGFLLHGSRESLSSELTALGGAAATPTAFTRRRVATASPAWGHELQAGRFPPEVGFVAAVSYDKGCYMGQEPLARIHARGQVNRVMVRVHAAEPPAAGTAEALELSAESRAKAGQWTTWIPEANAEGLAVVHRSLATPGTTLLAATDAGTLTLEVRTGPLGDDPGMGGRTKAVIATLGRR